MSEDRAGNADIGHGNGAAVEPAGKQQMTGFLAEERDRASRAYRGAHHRARRAVDAARQIDGDHRRGVCIHRFDHRACEPLDRPVEAGAEQRVDDEIGAIESAGCGRHDWTVPLFCGERGVALEPARLADQQYVHRVAARGEQPRRDKAIAAVITGPGNHNDAAGGGPARRNRLGNRRAGTLHERDARNAAGDCQPVGLRHLDGAEDLDHDRSHNSECAVWRISRDPSRHRSRRSLTKL